MRARFVPWTLALLTPVTTASADGQEPRIVTACELYQAPSSVQGKVRLQATVYKDARHGARITSSGCPKGTFIEMSFAEDDSAEPTARTFHDALWGDVMDISMRAFDFEAEGMFESERPARPSGIFYVKHVDWYRTHSSKP